MLIFEIYRIKKSGWNKLQAKSEETLYKVEKRYLFKGKDLEGANFKIEDLLIN